MKTKKEDPEKPKRRRGRPPKKPVEKPVFKSDRDVRDFLISEGIDLTISALEMAKKKNNIKNPKIANAKNQQYKTALTGLKVIDRILKNKQIDKLEEQLQLMEEGLEEHIKFIEEKEELLSAEEEKALEKSKEKLAKVNKLTEELIEIKE